MITQIFALNGGEVSRRLWHRSDLVRYYSSLSELENWLTLPDGGITRRAGLAHVDTYGPEFVWLAPFRYSAASASVLAFGENRLRIYTGGAVVESSPGIPLEVATPYAASGLRLLRWEQVGNVVFLTHPDHFPHLLTRVSATSWTLVEMPLVSHPFKDPNTNRTLTVTPSATTGAGVTLTASAALWDAGHVGARWRIGHVRPNNTVSIPITGNGNSSALLVQGDYTFRTSGIWAATVVIAESVDGSTWETVASWKGEGDMNISFTGFSDRPVYLRASVTSYASSTGAPVAAVDAADTVVWGSGLITGRASATSVTVTIEEPLLSTDATYRHAEGSWSASAGYPRQALLHDGRIWFASTVDEPLTLWGSAADEFDDFRRYPGAPDLGIIRTLYSATADQIQWMVSRGGSIIIGTAGDEWIVRNASSTGASVAKSTNYGSANVGAVELNDSLLFVEGLGSRMRDYIGLDVQRDDLARDPYAAGDLTRVAEHITEAGIEQMAVSQSPDPIIWSIVDGGLVGLTYDRAEQVIGWHRHPTAGTVYSVATIPGQFGNEVWISVERNGQTRIERLHPETPKAALAGRTADCLYLDSGVLVDLGTPGVVVTGLSHLEGRTVDVLVDGGTHPQRVVSGGRIELSLPGQKVAVGLPMVAVMSSLPLVAQSQTGSTRYLIGRIHEIAVDVRQTFGLEFADAAVGRWYAMMQRLGTDDPLLPPPLRSSPVKLPVGGGFSRESIIRIRQAVPLPATILGLAISWDASER